jgi:hypothetical protein
MKLFVLVLISCFFFNRLLSQELFLFTNPASNVSKNALILRGMNSFFTRTLDRSTSFHFMPEVEYGITKKVMLISNAFLSNENNQVNIEGGSLLVQYRFFSRDAVKRHFRMAAWGRFSINSAEIHQQEIELNGHNSGFRFGVTTTQLVHKTAISATFSYQYARNNLNNPVPQYFSNQSFDYTLSLGQLCLPQTYKNFKQTNVNFMIEALGQVHPSNRTSFMDIAPVIQFVFRSKARLDLAYRFQVYSSLLRTQPNGLVVNFQYSIFNAFIKKKNS